MSKDAEKFLLQLQDASKCSEQLANRIIQMFSKGNAKDLGNFAMKLVNQNVKNVGTFKSTEAIGCLLETSLAAVQALYRFETTLKLKKWDVERAHSAVVGKMLDVGQLDMAVEPLTLLRSKIIKGSGMKEPPPLPQPANVSVKPKGKSKIHQIRAKLEAEAIPTTHTTLDWRFSLGLLEQDDVLISLVLDCQHHVARVLTAQGQWHALRVMIDGGEPSLETWLTKATERERAKGTLGVATRAAGRMGRVFFDAAAKLSLQPKVSLWLRAASFACISQTDSCSLETLLDQVLKAGVSFEKSITSALAEVDSNDVKNLADFYNKMEKLISTRYPSNTQKTSVWFEHLAYVARKMSQPTLASEASQKCLTLLDNKNAPSLQRVCFYLDMITNGLETGDLGDLLTKLEQCKDISWKDSSLIGKFARSCNALRRVSVNCGSPALPFLEFTNTLCHQGIITNPTKSLVRNCLELHLAMTRIFVATPNVESQAQALDNLNQALELIRRPEVCSRESLCWLANGFYLAGSSACKTPDMMPLAIQAMEISCGLLEEAATQFDEPSPSLVTCTRDDVELPDAGMSTSKVYHQLSTRLEGLAMTYNDAGDIDKVLDAIRRSILAVFECPSQDSLKADHIVQRSRLTTLLTRAHKCQIRCNSNQSVLDSLLDDSPFATDFLELELQTLQNMAQTPSSLTLESTVISTILKRISNTTLLKARWLLEDVKVSRACVGITFARDGVQTCLEAIDILKRDVDPQSKDVREKRLERNALLAWGYMQLGMFRNECGNFDEKPFVMAISLWEALLQPSHPNHETTPTRPPPKNVFKLRQKTPAPSTPRPSIASEDSDDEPYVDSQHVLSNFRILSEYLSAIGQTRLQLTALKVALQHANNLTNSTERNRESMECFTDMADAYLLMGYTSLASQAHEQCLELVKTELEPMTLLRWHLSYAHYLCSIGEVDSGKKHLDNAHDISVLQTDNKSVRRTLQLLTAKAFYVQASICFAQENVPEAIHNACMCLKLLLRLGHKEADLGEVTQLEKLADAGKWKLASALFECYESLGQMYLLCGMAAEAMFYFEQGLKLSEACCAEQGQVRFSLFVAEVEYRRLLLDKSAQRLESATSLQRKIRLEEDSKEDVFLHLRRGDWHLREETYDKAAENYKQAGKVADKISASDFIAQMSHLNLNVDTVTPREKRLLRSPALSRRSLTGLSLWANNQAAELEAHLLKYLKTDAVSRLALTYAKHGQLGRAIHVLDAEGDEVEQMEHLAALGMIKLQQVRTKISSQSLSLNSLESVFASQRQKFSQPSPETLADIESAQDCLQQAYESALAYGNYTLLRDVSRGLGILSICRMHLESFDKEDEWDTFVQKAAYHLDLPTGITAHRELLACCVDRALGREEPAWPTSFSVPEVQDAGLQRWMLLHRLHQTDISPQAGEKFVQEFSGMIPNNWTICSLSADLDRGDLYVTRFQKDQSPLLLRLPVKRHGQREGSSEGFTFNDALCELAEIIETSNGTLHNGQKYETKEAKIEWWQTRKELDQRLKTLLENMEIHWLGGFKGLLNGKIPIVKDWSQDSSETRAIHHLKSKLEPLLFDQIQHNNKLGRNKSPVKGSGMLELDPVLCQVFVRLGNDPDDSDLEDIMYYIFEMYEACGMIVEYDEVDVDRVTVDMKEIFTSSFAMLEQDTPQDVAGPLDSEQFVILVLDKDLQVLPWESLPVLRSQPTSRCPSLTFVRDRIVQSKLWMGKELVDAVMDANQDDDFMARYCVDQSKTAYLLNPSKDLINTQKEFQPLLESQAWNGVTGRLPSQEEMQSWLGGNDVFCYFGHGGGDQYLRAKDLKRLDRCSVALLMGCSSARLIEQGEFEPRGNALNYLIAGCPAVVGNLWDVTDKDIDRFTKIMMQEWGLTKPLKESEWTWCGKSLATSVCQSRDECTLKYLNGSSPVVYGIPEVYVATKSESPKTPEKKKTVAQPTRRK